jgi:putative oxidoreductase
MSIPISFFMLLGRILISAIFILAGINKFIDYEGTAAYMASKNMPLIPLFLYAAALVELFGGLSVLLGFKTRYGALALGLFLIPVSIVFHDFWNITAQVEKQEQMIHFFSNAAILGGLLYVICFAAGAFSIDRNIN